MHKKLAKHLLVSWKAVNINHKGALPSLWPNTKCKAVEVLPWNRLSICGISVHFGVGLFLSHILWGDHWYSHSKSNQKNSAICRGYVGPAGVVNFYDVITPTSVMTFPTTLIIPTNEIKCLGVCQRYVCNFLQNFRMGGTFLRCDQ